MYDGPVWLLEISYQTYLFLSSGLEKLPPEHYKPLNYLKQFVLKKALLIIHHPSIEHFYLHLNTCFHHVNILLIYLKDNLEYVLVKF